MRHQKLVVYLDGRVWANFDYSSSCFVAYINHHYVA